MDYSRIADHFGITLPEDLVFCATHADALARAEPGSIGEYHVLLTPDEMVEQSWGPEMPPDLLPVLGNGAGDYLTVRWDWHGQMSGIVEWKHDSIERLPLGANLVEGLLLDYLRTRNVDATVNLGSWAMAQESLPGIGTPSFAAVAITIDEAEALLLDRNIGASDTRRLRCERLLRNVQYSAGVGIRPDQVALLEACNRLARAALTSATNLAWPYIIMGVMSEHAQQLEEAAHFYMEGIQCPRGTQVFWHWDEGTSAKFCDAQLMRLRPNEQDDYRSHLRVPEAQRQESIERYWLRQADRFGTEGNAAGEWRALLAAMYDLNGYSPRRGEIMSRAAQLAELHGPRVLARLSASRAAAVDPLDDLDQAALLAELGLD